MQNEVWVHWAYNRICVLDINITCAHNDQVCTGIEPALLSTIEKLNRSALTNKSQRLCTKQNNGNTQTDDLTLLSLTRKPWVSCKNESINCISTDQVQWMFVVSKWLFYLNTGIFIGSWVVKKVNSCLIIWIKSFILSKIKIVFKAISQISAKIDIIKRKLRIQTLRYPLLLIPIFFM